MTETNVLAPLVAIVERDGFAFVHGADMQTIVARFGSLADWDRFAASWNDLGLDTYMADGGRYRKRRHAAYAVGPTPPPSPPARGGEQVAATHLPLPLREGAGGRGLEAPQSSLASIRRKPHQAHYQSRDYNPLHGGIARWFDPVLEEIGAGPSMTTILAFCHALFDRLTPARDGAPLRWHVEVHQFRIEARAGQAGRPTPEGTHQDGVDHVLVLLIGRNNVREGVTTVTDLARRPLGSFTLTEPFDAALVDDNRVMHGVTPVEPIDPTRPGYRDVLVVTFRREN